MDSMWAKDMTYGKIDLNGDADSVNRLSAKAKSLIETIPRAHVRHSDNALAEILKELREIKMLLLKHSASASNL